MGRKVQVQKEDILSTAFEMLKEEGAEALNISKIAKKMGTSTQPISWQFGGMDGLRAELAQKVAEYLNIQAAKTAQQFIGKKYPIGVFLEIGKAEINLIFDEVNLSEFVRYTRKGKGLSPSIDSILHTPTHASMIHGIAEEFSIKEKDAYDIVKDCLIYSQGLGATILSGLVDCGKEEAGKLIQEHGIRVIASYGCDKDVIREHMDKFI